MKTHRRLSSAVRNSLLYIAITVVILCSNVVYGAGLSSPTTRVNVAGDKFDGTVQLAVAFQFSNWSLFRSRHIELAVGSLSTSSDNEIFVSVGPVWRTALSRNRYFAEFGFAPTLISGSRYNGRDLGGHLHFTSSVSVGKRFGRSNTVALRIQHTSNGGLNETNPGIDMIGIEYTASFSE